MGHSLKMHFDWNLGLFKGETRGLAIVSLQLRRTGLSSPKPWRRPGPTVRG